MDLRNGKRLLLLVSATGLNHWLVSYLVWMLQLLKPQQPRDPWHTQSLELGRLLSPLWESNCWERSCQELRWLKAPHHPPTQNGLLHIITPLTVFHVEEESKPKLCPECCQMFVFVIRFHSWLQVLEFDKFWMGRDIWNRTLCSIINQHSFKQCFKFTLWWSERTHKDGT